MTEIVTARSGVPIRLTDERWGHIVEEHCELAGLRTEVLETVSDSERVLSATPASYSHCAVSTHGGDWS
jgi:hypothetical protein